MSPLPALLTTGRFAGASDPCDAVCLEARVPVLELLVAMAPLLLLSGLAVTAIFVPLQVVAAFALSLMAVGFLLGVPSGLAYHWVLRRELMRVGPLPKGWYWHPQQHHGTLLPGAIKRMRPWFLIGAGGFGLIILGFALSVLALAMWFRTGSSLTS